MQVNLNLDYAVDSNSDRFNPNFATNAQLSITLIRTAINSVKNPERGGHKNRDEIRLAAKLVNALTNASNAKATTINLDPIVVLYLREMLKAWMNEIGVPGGLAGWFDDLLTYVEKLADEVEQSKKSGG